MRRKLCNDAMDTETCEWCGLETDPINIDGDCLRCENCFGALWVRCDVCHGVGSGPECDIEMDWINFGYTQVLCQNCSGKGWVR